MSFDTFATLNIAILVLAAGNWLNRRFRVLQDFNIPEPVSSGLLVGVLTAVLYLAFGLEVTFDTRARDFLLLYFFAGIGLNSDLKSLLAGGVPLLVLVAALVVFMFLQNLAGIGVAAVLGVDPLIGLVAGTVSFIGGHGTTVAWAPVLADRHGITNAAEIGISCATLGLVASSLMGGPVAGFLIKRRGLAPRDIVQPDVGITYDRKTEDIGYFGMLRSLFWLNMCVALGGLVDGGLRLLGAELPLFVCVLFAAILLTNTLPRAVPRLQWPAGSRALALLSDVSLGVFLAMSLMGLQLWAILDLAGPLLAIFLTQVALALVYTVFVVFRVMGRDYEAAVISAGFAGVSLGATPTAMANMTAVTKTYGLAHRAFIIVPLVSGFFVSIANSVVIAKFLEWFG